jgi:hypothetical protein
MIILVSFSDSSSKSLFCMVYKEHIVLNPQSKECYRGSTELVQHFVERGNLHRRKDTASHKIDMVWLYRSPILVGRRGVFNLFKCRLYPPSRRLEDGEGGESAPCD